MKLTGERYIYVTDILHGLDDNGTSINEMAQHYANLMFDYSDEYIFTLWKSVKRITE